MDPVAWLGKHLEEADTDLLRELVRTFVEQLMGAQADALCGAAYGERSPDRTNRRNGYRSRDFDTRAGTIPLQIPKLQEGSYFPNWLLERRRRAERALVQVVAECYVKGVSTRRVDGLVRTLGIEGISKSQVSQLAKSLDEHVQAFRSRPLDTGPYTYAWLDALALKCREGGRGWWRPPGKGCRPGRARRGSSWHPTGGGPCASGRSPPPGRGRSGAGDRYGRLDRDSSPSIPSSW
jgi:putative transposase